MIFLDTNCLMVLSDKVPIALQSSMGLGVLLEPDLAPTGAGNRELFCLLPSSHLR